MKIKYFALSIALIISASVNAADWVFITSADDGTKYYIDVDSIVKDKNLISYWVLADLQKSEKTYDGTKTYKSKKDKHVVNCQSKEFALEFQVSYSDSMGKGNTVIFNRYNKTFDPIAPGTVGENLINFACSTSIKNK